MEKYHVGVTVRTTVNHPHGIPCIIYDGDSVLCEFPSQPNGHRQAEEVARILNEAARGQLAS